ncbi:hypothetical protein [Sporosarcina aquimarina]|uniref:Uncharacterized protein n=1 Tax=Sporosarcina aquimarina TaxID=114975 RepID=A0ABU4G393_9BACL|nr:hypothetical protein [Sporosarcina aquimarina]MDW0111432.1 hypothetical protein [Sporosarcina aquimarina]
MRWASIGDIGKMESGIGIIELGIGTLERRIGKMEKLIGKGRRFKSVKGLIGSASLV